MTYTVQRGDTLGKIAARFQTSVAALVQANPVIRNPDLINVGQVLQLPTGKPGLPAPPKLPTAPPLPAAPKLPAAAPPPAPAGPLAANTWGIDLAKLLDLHARMDKVKYGLGDKANPKTAEPETIKSIDCSGYVRFVLYKASGGKVDCSPNGGSWHQNEWCKAKLTAITYEAATAGASDGKLRIAFYKPAKGVGHVWLILNGKTLESYGGHGVGRKAWDSRTSIADKAYVF